MTTNHDPDTPPVWITASITLPPSPDAGGRGREGQMIATYGGWLANALLLTGSFWVGAKRKTGFAIIALGELAWLVTVSNRLPVAWDMVFICCVFGLMAAINFCRWHWMDLQEQEDGIDQAEA